MKRYCVLFAILFLFSSLSIAAAEQIRDHDVVLDEDGRLLPWTTYDFIIDASVDFIKNCLTSQTRFGNDPWYLKYGKFYIDASQAYNKQNNQGSNAYYAVDTLGRYYAYTGDRDALKPAKLLLDRLLYYATPEDWVWPNVPITQDDNYDGEYTDDWSEPDKMCMVGLGCVRYYKITGEKKYLNAAIKIADTVSQHVTVGSELKPPIPFRVRPKDGKVMDSYTANMIFPLKFYDELVALGYAGQKGEYHTIRSTLRAWILKYPMMNYRWSGYYEDVINDNNNLNQQVPMETARYMLDHPDFDPNYKEHVPALLFWVENRFGQTKQHGATSIREQDTCYQQMSSHTARYASVAAKWYGATLDPGYHEEARAAFALSTYTAYNKYSKDGLSINYTGIDYTEPWFSDSYFDYLTHYFEGMAEMPDMAPADEDHLLKTTSLVTHIKYGKGRIEYKTFDPSGDEILRLTFNPKVYADGKPLDRKSWEFGEYRGVSNVLRIHRDGTKKISVMKE